MKRVQPPRILVAPGPFKECLSAPQVAQAMLSGVRDILPEALVTLRPLSDGGSGIAELLVDATNGRLVDVQITGPLGRKVSAFYGILGDGQTAVIESAAACGLALVPPQKRNPLRTTTRGVGELISHAVHEGGATHVIVGCGDSGTNDCGIGMARALGVQFSGLRHRSTLTGRDLCKVKGVATSGISPKVLEARYTVACNLTSILCGVDGTSRIYGPQKGATADQILFLEDGVSNFVEVLYNDLGKDVAYLPGAGGAGGLAASLYSFLDASLCFSFDVVHRYLNLDAYLEQSDLVITGEGKVDDRTATGKIACALALKAKRYNLPVIAVTGIVADDCEDIYYNGIDAVAAIQTGPMTQEESIRRAEELIAETTSRALRFVFRVGNL